MTTKRRLTDESLAKMQARSDSANGQTFEAKCPGWAFDSLVSEVQESRARIAELEAQNAELREAFEPFARGFQLAKGRSAWASAHVNPGAYERAAALLGKGGK